MGLKSLLLVAGDPVGAFFGVQTLGPEPSLAPTERLLALMSSLLDHLAEKKIKKICQT